MVQTTAAGTFFSARERACKSHLSAGVWGRKNNIKQPKVLRNGWDELHTTRGAQEAGTNQRALTG